MEVLLKATALNKAYTTGRDNIQQVLRDVDLSIHKGEFVSVMGPSGSGKSTLLYTVSGMDRMTTGSVRFLDRELGGMPEEALSALRLTSMGFIFQQSNLLKNLSILDNILLSAYLLGKQSRPDAQKRARGLMEQLGIGELADRDITQASGGQLQRAAICRALINSPSMLFGDEPTGALNAAATGDVMDILADIHAGGATILLVTHDAKVAARSQRVLFMTDGRIAAETSLGVCPGDRGAVRRREAELTDWLRAQGF